MRIRTLTVAFVICVVLLPALSSSAPPGCATNISAGDAIFLQDKGSTNTAAFCYTITRSGTAIKGTATRYDPAPGTRTPLDERGNIPVALAEKLFRDAEAGMPLSALTLPRCVKSASFGSSQYVWFKGERSPDLCGPGVGSGPIEALEEDFASVWGALQKRTGQTSAAEATVDPPHVEADLSVSAEIVSQDYCRLTAEDHEVHFSVRLTFTNVSDHRVILERDVERPPLVTVARNVADAQNGHFEYTFNLGPITGLSTAPPFGDRPNDTYFITLLPGQTYEATVTVPILVPEKSATTGKGPAGDHVLQVALNTFPYQTGIYTNPANARQLSLRWSKYGHLATGWIYSDFAPLSLPELFDDAVCESPKS